VDQIKFFFIGNVIKKEEKQGKKDKTKTVKKTEKLNYRIIQPLHTRSGLGVFKTRKNRKKQIKAEKVYS